MLILVQMQEKDAVSRQQGLSLVNDVKNGIRNRHMNRIKICSIIYKGMISLDNFLSMDELAVFMKLFPFFLLLKSQKGQPVI